MGWIGRGVVPFSRPYPHTLTRIDHGEEARLYWGFAFGPLYGLARLESFHALVVWLPSGISEFSNTLQGALASCGGRANL